MPRVQMPFHRVSEMRQLPKIIPLFAALLAVAAAAFLFFNPQKQKPVTSGPQSAAVPFSGRGTQIDTDNLEQPPAQAPAPETAQNVPAEDPFDKLVDALASEDFPESKLAADTLAAKGSEAVACLTRRLPQAPLPLKAQILFLLGRIGDTAGTAAVSGYCRDDNAYLRRNAVEALGKMNDPAAVSDLAYALNDEDISVREKAARALGKTGGRGAVNDLARRLAIEQEERVKSALAAALGKIGDPRGTQILLQELSGEKNQFYLNTVVAALGETKDGAALSPLQTYLKDLSGREPKENESLAVWREAVKTAETAVASIEKNNQL